ncbi:MAG: hypothetical protein J0L55_14720 [Caulobacterales bacterium]|nr:hypothetical protein [Caulobacterales bacterium]
MRALKISLIVFGIAAILGISVVLARFVFKINPKDHFANNGANSQEVGDMFGNHLPAQELDPAQMLPVTTIITPSVQNDEKSSAELDANAAQAAVSGCNLFAQKPIHIKNWEVKGNIIANSEGENCASALVKIMLKDETGKTLFTMTAPAKDFGISEETKKEDITNALSDALPNSAIRAKAYPEWKIGEERPFGSEFDQITYEKIRALDTPIICLKIPSAPQTCISANPENGEIKTFSRG